MATHLGKSLVVGESAAKRINVQRLLGYVETAVCKAWEGDEERPSALQTDDDVRTFIAQLLDRLLSALRVDEKVEFDIQPDPDDPHSLQVTWRINQ